MKKPWSRASRYQLLSAFLVCSASLDGSSIGKSFRDYFAVLKTCNRGIASDDFSLMDRVFPFDRLRRLVVVTDTTS